MMLFTLVCVALIFVGMNADLGRFITPETGSATSWASSAAA